MENEEDKLMHEAEVSTLENPSEPTVTKMRKRRNDLYIELALFFILGILVGVAVKNEAVKKVTMGFDDYQMKIFKQDYDLNALTAKVALQQAQDAQAKADNSTASQSAPAENQNAPAGN